MVCREGGKRAQPGDLYRCARCNGRTCLHFQSGTVARRAACVADPARRRARRVEYGQNDYTQVRPVILTRFRRAA